MASSSLRPAFSSSFQPVVSAYGWTVWTHRVLGDETIRVDVVRRQQRDQPLGLELAGPQQRPEPVVTRRHDFRDRALACRSTTRARVFFGRLRASFSVSRSRG